MNELVVSLGVYLASYFMCTYSSIDYTTSMVIACSLALFSRTGFIVRNQERILSKLEAIEEALLGERTDGA